MPLSERIYREQSHVIAALDFAARGGCGECRQGTRGIEALSFEFVGYLLGDFMATTLIDQCDD